MSKNIAAQHFDVECTFRHFMQPSYKPHYTTCPSVFSDLPIDNNKLQLHVL